MAWPRRNFLALVRELRQILRGKVGESWVEVHSLVMGRLDVRTVGGAEVREQLQREVETQARVVAGRVFGPDGRLCFAKYYVDEQGVLQRVPRTHCKAERRANAAEIDPTIRQVSETEEYRRIKGVWYHFRFREAIGIEEKERAAYLYDSRSPIGLRLQDGRVVKRIDDGWDRGMKYRYFLPIEKRALSGAEIRKLKLPKGGR